MVLVVNPAGRFKEAYSMSESKGVRHNMESEGNGKLGYESTDNHGASLALGEETGPLPKTGVAIF
jgi:hypothetical protein